MDRVAKEAYKDSMKMREYIEKNFGVQSATEAIRSMPGGKVSRFASVRTKAGFLVEWEGVWFTEQETKEIDMEERI